MLTLAPIRTPECVVDHVTAVHRHGSVAQAGLDLAALVAPARHRGKAPSPPVPVAIHAASAAVASIRATEC